MLTYYLLAQIPLDIKHIDELANKDFKWWFAAMFIIGLAGTIYIFKLQLGQNADQRQAHALMTDKLINYITNDHAKAIVTVESSTQIMAKTSQTLERVVQVLEHVTQILHNKNNLK